MFIFLPPRCVFLLPVSTSSVLSEPSVPLLQLTLLPLIVDLGIKDLGDLWNFGQTLTLSKRETRRKTLEEIAAAFGDKVVMLTETDLAVERAVLEDKVSALQVESAPTSSRV